MAKQGLFYLPDISGFTSFVKENEVEHSQHIVSELLELIISADELGLTVAEIEGDAVFFYKEDDLPTAEDLLRQSEKMYIKFHEHLKYYETRRICQCGACTTAVNLSLKFFAHQGEFSLIDVNGKQKPFGEDVIKIHRLMKNSVSSNEYVLFTNNILVSLSDELSKNSEVGQDDYAELGTINYNSFDLSGLQSKVRMPPVLPSHELNENPLFGAIQIKSSKSSVYELISNLGKRHFWNKNVDAFEYNKNEVNHVGSKHVCLFDHNSIEFETVTNNFGKGKLVYGERTNQLPLIKEATTYYIIDGDDEQTSVRVETHLTASPFKLWIFKLLLSNKFQKSIKNALTQIKFVSEKGTLFLPKH